MMANVLTVTTRKFGHPLVGVVEVIASDQSTHESRVAT
jgi:hypothetical protein